MKVQVKRPSRERIEKSARIYKNARAAGEAFGVSGATYRRWCVHYEIEVPRSIATNKEGRYAEK